MHNSQYKDFIQENLLSCILCSTFRFMDTRMGTMKYHERKTLVIILIIYFLYFTRKWRWLKFWTIESVGKPSCAEEQQQICE